MHGQRPLRHFLMLVLLAGGSAAWADDVTIPNIFVAGSPAVAAEVNANFAAVAAAVNDNAADVGVHDAAIASNAALIAALQSALAAQQATIDSLSTSIASLTSQLAAVQGSSVMALAPNLDLVYLPDPNQPGVEYLTAELHGINVRIVNGAGATATANGLGNLTVGYNEIDAAAIAVCSNGQFANETTCTNFGGTWAGNHRGGSHNLIVGAGNAYSQYGGLLVGDRNTVNSPYASVSGGRGNLASGISASVSGGSYNTASSSYTTVSGGSYNVASVINAAVNGGLANRAAANNATVNGGANNTAAGNYSTVSGGFERSVINNWDWRAGSLFENQ
jgi:hypothetical protein